MATPYYRSEFSPFEISSEEGLSTSVLSKSKRATWAKYNPISVTKSCLSVWRCSHVWCNTRPLSKQALFCRLVRRPFWGLIILLGLLKLLSLTWQGLVYLFPDDLDSALDAWVLPGGRPSIFSHWATYGVIPVACHSHNDYWRRVPLHSALAAGCTSIEADVWLSGNELLVGHLPLTLTQDQSLRSLYLDPLLKMLEDHNPRSVNLSLDDNADRNDVAGVFANDPSQSLVLLVDFKADGEHLWPRLVENLKPLREAGYLTHFNGSSVIQRPITVVVSGDAPFHRLFGQITYRDIFFDTPLDDISAHCSQRSADKLPYTPSNSYYASVNFYKAIGHLNFNRFSQSQLSKLRCQINAAHERGLKVRYWGTPSWPRGLRNHVWHILVREGVDVINVDDLRDATQRDWRKHRSWWS
ncbi:hypothetical protein L228DRAFT_208682 [Xylona heveae TC161]|uniref:Altered inheritance of mitochondria protein 6 n=1 Tax=Xylona heveae (strain CBS 132557 / TC161) TaxID=1328760 RepID=A0A161TP64_XYLHT|nr:hypothetical protein L228DRAFT_208682 [Xylona heveae TC161]KZF23916.1 hypothetical protein L228DRAFT_208682 [Xylona heveae TC161]